MVEEYTVDDLNPRAEATKTLEMAVLRTMQLIEVWDELGPGEDWTCTPAAKYRKILGNDHYQQRAVLLECWKRYEGGTLYQQVLDLHGNLPSNIWDAKPGDKKERRDELKRRRDGIAGIKSRIDSRGKRRTPKPAARQRSRRA